MKKLQLFFFLMIVGGIQIAFAQSSAVTFANSPKFDPVASSFRSGEFIYARVQLAKPLGETLVLGERPVTLIAEYYIKGKMIDDEMYGFDVANVRKSKITSLLLPVISDPASDLTVFGRNLFAVRLPAALAKLGEGAHEVEYKVKSYEFKNGDEPLATGKFTLNIDAGGRAFYAANEKAAMAAFSKRGITSVVVSERDLAMGVVGGKSVVTLVNNCGRSVWLRKALGSDKREYRLAPGQTMLYDRDSGYLEEWNFGTQKWSTVSKVWTADANGKANICSK